MRTPYKMSFICVRGIINGTITPIYSDNDFLKTYNNVSNYIMKTKISDFRSGFLGVPIW